MRDSTIRATINSTPIPGVAPLTHESTRKVGPTMGRNAKPARAYNFVVTGIDVDGHRFRLETNTLGLAQQITPWRGTLWLVEADGTRRAHTNYRHGKPVSE